MFSDELHIFFQYLGRQILSEVDLKNPLESVFYGHVTDTINKYWVEYDKILSHYVDKAAIIGNVHYEILLNASKDRAEHFQATKAKNNNRQFLDNALATSDNNELFAPNPKVSSRLKRKKFEASEKTRARVDKEINNILGEAYREGWGPRYVGDKIRQRFTDLSTYEARRIAQTEINTTRNYVQYQRMQDDEMEYKIWHAAHDSRTRKSHLKVDEEIVPINERFSNGLMYPGDKDGDPSEWVNCRCSHAAYIMPLGFEAPDFFPFTESDLVKVGSSLSKDYVSEIQERIRLIDGAMVREQEENNIPMSEVDDILTGIMDDYGLAKPKPKPKPKTKPKPVKPKPPKVNPKPKVEKPKPKEPKQTKPKNNGDHLWEDLATKYELEFVKFDGATIEFYDPKHNTPLKFYTERNKQWIDYTNSGKRNINIETILKEYNAMPSLHKNAAPQIKFVGDRFNLAGEYTLGQQGHTEIQIAKAAYAPKKGDTTDIGTTLRHETSHAVDSKFIFDMNMAKMSKNFWFTGNHPELDNGAYRKAVAKDRRNRKKTGGQNYVSEYARQSGNYQEDFAEALALRSYRDAPAALRKKACLWERRDGKLVKVTYDEFEKMYPNRCKVLDEILDNYTLGW